MGKTLDRYVLNRFLVLFVGFFAASMGLFAVVDGFTNLDGFQSEVKGEGTFALLSFMGWMYVIQSSWVFDLIGPTLATMSVVSVLALMVRHGELNSLLAAGVPTYRLAYPFLIGVFLVHGLLAANKELIIPRIAVHLTGHHGEDGRDGQQVEPVRDDVRGIFITGREIIPATGVLHEAEFRLNHVLVHGHVSLRASQAKHYQARGEQEPAGWMLKNAHPRFEDLRLTDRGRQTIVPQPNGRDVFVVTDVSWDQLLNQGTTFSYLSTPDLVERIRRPTSRTPYLRAQVLHLHSRLTRPLLNVLGVFLVIPLVVRRESPSQVTNLTNCMAVLAGVMGLVKVFEFLGGSMAVVSTEAATWIPLIIGGGFAAWISPHVQT